MTRFSSAFIGNTDTVRRLCLAELSGAGAHALLITGPERIGKRTLAIQFAALATCLSPRDANACGECASCAAANRGAHPDIHLVERRDEKRTIVVEQAQEVVHIATIRPYQSDCKVIIIADANTLEERAANLLLKTIEEPPNDTRIVLTSGDGDRILPTIRSRCREVALRLVPATTIAEELVTRGVSLDQATLVARLSSGCPGWALSAVGDPAILATRATHLDLLMAVVRANPFSRLPIADRLDDSRNLARTREAMSGAFSTWIRWWRDVLVVRAGCTHLVAGVDRLEELQATASRLSVSAITNAIARTELAATHLDDNVNPRLALEGLFLDLPSLGTD